MASLDRLYLTYAAVGTVGVLLALVSRRLRQLPLSEPLVALLLGVALGPQLLGLLEIEEQVRDPCCWKAHACCWPGR